MIALQHFARLAKSGRYDGASNGERRARELAECVMDKLGSLDSEAAQGFLEFSKLVISGQHSVARDLLKDKPPSSEQRS